MYDIRVSDRIKQVIIVRKDLRLKRAMLAALVSRASMEFLVSNNISKNPEEFKVEITRIESDWLGNGSSRIVLSAPSESFLRSLAFKAEMLGIASYSVSANSDSVDAISLGPDESDKIDEITGNLKLI